MLDLVKRLNDDGCTILFITHDMQLIAKYARNVIVFHDGKILLHKSTREAFSEAEILKQTFLSPPSITLLAKRFSRLYPDTMLTVEEMLDKTIDIVTCGRGPV